MYEENDSILLLRRLPSPDFLVDLADFLLHTERGARAACHGNPAKHGEEAGAQPFSNRSQRVRGNGTGPQQRRAAVYTVLNKDTRKWPRAGRKHRHKPHLAGVFAMALVWPKNCRATWLSVSVGGSLSTVSWAQRVPSVPAALTRRPLHKNSKPSCLSWSTTAYPAWASTRCASGAIFTG